MPIHRRNMLKAIAAPILAAPALVLPSRSATALCSLQVPLLPPGAAPGFPGHGINQNFLWDDFLSTSTIDTTNTLAPGFNWYLDNTKSWAGASRPFQQPSILGIDYTIGGSNINIVGTSAFGSGLQFATYGYVATPTPHLITSVPVLTGSKPFYIECRAKFNTGNYTAFWMQDAAGILRSIINSSETFLAAEFDIIENNTINNNQTMWTWDSAIHQTGRRSGPLVNSQNAWHTFGLLVVPTAFNSGVGIAQFYYDRNPNLAVVNWLNNTDPIETANYMIFLAGSNAETAQYDYVGVWTAP